MPPGGLPLTNAKAELDSRYKLITISAVYILYQDSAWMNDKAPHIA